MSRVSRRTSWIALVLSACGSPVGVADFASEGSSTDAPLTETSESTSVDAFADESSSSTTDEVLDEGPAIFDVLGLPDAPPIEDGCGAVDFLFVIDNSGSMYDEQVKLGANFPVFSQGIQSTLENVTSYQVGVVATDAYVHNDAPCGELGDLVISTEGGYDSSNMVCGPYEDGHNFMTEADDLGTSFACAARLGSFGDGFEKPMEAMVRAVGDFHDGPGECNEGFIRDEALLVVVVITDEHDGIGDPEGAAASSEGDPDSWYEAVVAAKGGIEQNAVVMSLINYHADDGDAPSPCVPTDPYSDGVNIKHFTQKFGDNGFVGGICQADYGPIFEQAIGVIATACDNFVPPG
jgi:hypothetical protein